MPRLSVLLLDVSHDFTLGVEALSDWVQLPVGLLWLSSYLRSRYSRDEVSVTVLDVAMDPGHYDTVRRLVGELAPALVGIRALSPTAGQAHETAKLVKTWRPGAVVVGGGPYASASPESAMLDPNVDAVCVGEGEHVLAELVGRLLAGHADLGEVRGLLYRRGDEVLRSPPMPPIEDLDSLPFPDYHDLDIASYVGKHPHTAVGRPYASLVCSRGCPYNCIYCHAIFGRRLRHRSPANVALEVQQLHDRHGIGSFIIGDDSFNVNLPWAKEVLRAIAALKINARLFYANGLRGDVFDEEFADLMAAAGVVEVVYAVESASPRIQEMLQKRLDLPKVEQAIEQTARRGILVNGFFMIGFPSETRDELAMTVAFIQRHLDHIDFPYLSVVRAFEGTPLFALARTLGYSDEFMRHHADMPYGMQVRVFSEYNFLPNDLLKWARLQVAFDLYSVKRMHRVLGRMRRVLDEDEVIMKFANCTANTKPAAAALVRRYDDGSLEGRGLPSARPQPGSGTPRG